MSKKQEVYLIIIYQRDKNETDGEIKFQDPKELINILFTEKEAKNDNKNEFRIVLRCIVNIQTTKKKANLKFAIKGDIYIITFDPNGKTFIYNLDLKKETSFYHLSQNEDQTSLKDFEKFNKFFTVLSNESKELILNLYEDSIDLYGGKPSFEFLINIFVKVYKISICSKLLDKFKNNVENEKQKNSIKNDELNKFKEKFEEICDNLEKILEDNKCNSIDFIGLILCYLNNYADNSFNKLFRHIYAKDSQILFEILLLYKPYFRNPIKFDEKILDEFINFTAGRTYGDLTKNALTYIKKLKEFLRVIDKFKEKLISIEGFEPLVLNKSDIKIPRNEINIINELVCSILNFSKEQKKLLISFDNKFWTLLIEECNSPTQENIESLTKIRENFISYFDLVKEIYQKDNNKKIVKGSILYNAKEFDDKNKIDLLLDKNIKQFIINKRKDITNIQIISLIKNSDPYFIENKEEYINKRDVNILENIDFQNIDDKFISVYKGYEFEIIFKKKINDYLSQFFEKVDNWEKFHYLVKLINDENLENKKVYVNLLKHKYDQLKQTKIPNELFEKIVETLINICDFMNLNNDEFYSTKISKLKDKKLINEIFIGLLSYCKDDKYSKMKKFIENYYIKDIKLENLNDTMIFLKSLKHEGYSDIMNRISNSYLVGDKEFYSKQTNIKIELLLKLKKNNLFYEDENKYYEESKKILDNIYSEIKEGKIRISKFNELLSENDEEHLKEKFKLLEESEADKFYEELKNVNKEIINKLKKLEFIEENLRKYHKEIYEKELEEIEKNINKIKTGTIDEYNSQIKHEFVDINLEEKAKSVNKVKKLKLFNIIYKYTKKTNEDGHFEIALKKLNNIKLIIKNNANANDEDKKILKEISDNNCEINKEIKAYFKDEEADNEISLFVSLPYFEKDIKSIFYFFDKLGNDENWNKILCPKYKQIFEKSNEEKKKILNELKQKEIYNYLTEHQSNKSFYLRFFNCLYNKEEAFNFLLNHNANDLKVLYEKLDPNVQNLTPSDIEYTITCVNFFKEFGQFNNDHELIFKHIKEKFTGNENLIKNFERFSVISDSIIDMYQNIEISTTLYEEIEKKFKNASFIFNRDNDEFYDNECNKISFDELMIYKNKIRVKSSINPSINKKEKDEEKENEEKIAQRNKHLLFFKDLLLIIGLIHDNMEFLRKKGSVLDIRIQIEIKEQNIIYHLGSHEVDYKYIESFLSKAKNNIVNKLEDFYKTSEGMRFFYGKQICYIINHLNGYNDSYSFLRYILNDIDSQTVEQGDKKNICHTKNYIKNYSIITRDSFNNICNYVNSLFINNNSSLEKHYSKMKIKCMENAPPLKGLYIYKSDSISETMEEDILQIFLDKIGCLPIAQNILIFNKETSFEEIQAFLYRGLLCKYNTIFVFEINESFTEYYQRYLNRMMDKILIHLNNIYNKIKNKKFKLEETSEYMESCFIFIYNEKNESSLNQIISLYKPNILNLFKNHSIGGDSFIIDDIHKINNEKRKEISNNVHVIKSEICGLGKSAKIRKEIKDKHKKYIHFPIGGNITRNYLFQKLEKIFSSTKKEDYMKTAIHLDLYDNKETSILNEFLFSFLITKFYANDENIMFIPKDIEIFIEVPNCFEDFITKYRILDAFHIELITLNKKPKLDLSPEKLLHFKNMIDTTDNNKIAEFINKYITIENHSYHQLNIFIDLFIGQYSKTNNKRIFYEGEEIATEKVIENFAKCTEYFTSGGYSNILVNKNNIINGENKIIFSLLSETYNKDLTNQKYEYPLIFRVPEKYIYYNLYLSKEKIEEEYKTYKENKYIKMKEKNKKNFKNINFDDFNKTTMEEYFLNKIKNVLDLKNPITSKESNNSTKRPLIDIIRKEKYVITYDNFRKMMLIIYRIIAKIPVILMGETGCGKTALIIILNKLLYNDDEDKNEHLEIINIHPGINDDILIKKMNNLNQKAQNMSGDLWIFFDELNTCDSLALLTEIFVNHSYDGTKLSDNIRIIGACNPYRLLEKGRIKCGLSHPNDLPDDYVYLVKLLPQSLMYYVFNFGSLDEEDEKLYISSIISELFNEKEKTLEKATQDLIFQCHDFLRKTYDKSIVSLRELSRFTKCFKFFMNDYLKKKEKYLGKKEKVKIIKNNEEENFKKIKSVILSIYICYYTRLIDEGNRRFFDGELKNYFLNVIDWNVQGNETDKNEPKLLGFIKNEFFRKKKK